MNRKLIAIAAVVLFLLLAFAGLGAYVLFKRKGARTPEQMFSQGAMRFNQRDYGGAYQLFAAAVQKDPGIASYSREAARAAAFQGWASEAQVYAQKTWENGLKDEDMLRILLAGYSPLEQTNGLDVALKLMEELPPDQRRPELRGDIYFHFKENAEANKAWLAGLAASPTNAGLVLKIAKAHLQSKDPESAKKFLGAQRGKGSLNEEAYSLLAFLHVAEEKYPPAFAVFEDAKREGQYHERLALENAILYLIIQRPIEAGAVLAPFKEPVEAFAADVIRTQARLFYEYVLLLKQDREAIKQLISLVAEKARPGAWKEGEDLYLKGLLQMLDNKPGALESLTKARKLIPSHPAIELVYAQESIKVQHYNEAVEALRDLRGVIERWPPAVFELAVALHASRQDKQALQILSRLHQRRFISKQSLELFRDIAFQNNLQKSSQAAQSVLEKQFPNDPDVQLFRGLSALQQGSYGKAGEIFQELNQRYPDDVRIKLGPIQVLLSEGKYQAALQACRTNSAPAELLAAMAGLAQVRLQQWDAAEASFARAITVDQPASIHTEYGKLLVQRKKLAEASVQFQKALDKAPDQVEAYMGLALIAADNKLWEDARKNALSALTLDAELPLARYILAVADTQAGDLAKALENCQRALKKDPKLTKARILAATLQGLLGQDKEAEQELVQLLAAQPNDPFLKQQLAVIYRRKGEYKKALELVNQVIPTASKSETLQMLRCELLALAGQPREAAAALDNLKPSLAPARHAMAASWLADVQGDVTKAVALLEPHLADRKVAMQWGSVQFKNRKEPASWLPLLKQQLSRNEWAELAATADKEEFWPAARFCYEQALKLDPNDPALLNNWAWAAMNTREFDKEKVLDACRRAYDAFPRSPPVLDTFAEALLRTGRFDECINLLSANLAVTRRTPQLLWVLAKAYESNNDFENALRTYRQVLDLQSKIKDWEVRVGKDSVTEQIQKLQSKAN